jgi:hypothetical protein
MGSLRGYMVLRVLSFTGYSNFAELSRNIVIDLLKYCVIKKSSQLIFASFIDFFCTFCFLLSYKSGNLSKNFLVRLRHGTGTCLHTQLTILVEIPCTFNYFRISEKFRQTGEMQVTNLVI